MARKTTAKSAHTDAITRDVKERGHSMLTGAWNSSAHTIHSVRKSEKRWSGAGDSWKARNMREANSYFKILAFGSAGSASDFE